MKVWDEISEIVRRNLKVFYEVEALDVGFRRSLDAAQRRDKAPWIMMGREKLCDEELEVWRRLDRQELSQGDAIAEMRSLMESYYGET
jgi:hypothetical protein